MTKVEALSNLLTLLPTNDFTPEVNQDLIDFCNREIDLIQQKAERAAKKARDEDILYDIVAEHLPVDYTPISDIVEAIVPYIPEDYILTAHKVSARLNTLTKEGLAEKVSKPIGKANRVHYRRISQPTEDLS